MVNVPDTSETTGTDGFITLSSDGGNYFSGATFAGSTYNDILNVGSDAINGQVTIGSAAHPLISGDIYRVEVWDSYGGSYTARVDGSPSDLNFPGYQTDYAIGTFTAGTTPFTFDYGPVAGNSGAGFINDIVVRDLSAPEPSTYAMMLGGLALLGFCLRRKAALLG